MITSLSNPKVQLVKALLQQKKVRTKEGLFVAEGVRLVEEALKRQISPAFLFSTPQLSIRGTSVLEGFRRQEVPVFEISDEIMGEVSDTETSQGILGVFSTELLLFPVAPTFVLVVNGVRDPGNLGTLIRTAWAAGVEGVITTEGTVDLYSPKVVRAGMGAHFAVPLKNSNREEINRELSANKKFRVYAAVVDEGKSIWECNFREPSAIIVGGEAEGVSGYILEMADEKITIPMTPQTESLNAGVAGSLILFEVFRQRNG